MARVNCPHCGRMIELEARAVQVQGWDPGKAAALRGLGMERKPHQVNYYSTAADLPAGAVGIAAAVARDNWQEVNFTEPSRAPTVQGDVAVPLAQAGITGALAGVLVAIMGGMAAGRFGWPWQGIAGAAGVVAIGATAAAWWALLQDTRGLLRRVESYVGRDLDGDGAIGYSEKPVTRVEVVERAHPSHDPDKLGVGDRLRTDTLPATPQELHTIAAAVLRGNNPLSRSTLTRAGLTDTRARAVLDAMYTAGYCRVSESGRNDPNGPDVTAKGRAVLLTFLEGAR